MQMCKQSWRFKVEAFTDEASRALLTSKFCRPEARLRREGGAYIHDKNGKNTKGPVAYWRLQITAFDRQ